jgi:hypothetical protein
MWHSRCNCMEDYRREHAGEIEFRCITVGQKTQHGVSMNRTSGQFYYEVSHRALSRRCFWAFAILFLAFATPALAKDVAQAGNSPSSVRAKHLLGFAGAHNNAKGTLSIEGDCVAFERNGRPAEKVNIGSIEAAVLGNESKQVGGIPMTLAKSAIPYSGGRVVSLFSHKHYDTLTLEYQDDDGGFHGAVFELKKGQAEGFRNELLTKRAGVADRGSQRTKQTAEVSSENK